MYRSLQRAQSPGSDKTHARVISSNATCCAASDLRFISESPTGAVSPGSRVNSERRGELEVPVDVSSCPSNDVRTRSHGCALGNAQSVHGCPSTSPSCTSHSLQ